MSQAMGLPLAHDSRVVPSGHMVCICIYYYFLPRYSVPEDLEITNKEKKNYNGCINGLAGS